MADTTTSTYTIVVDTQTNAQDTAARVAELDAQVKDDLATLAAMKKALQNLKGGGDDANGALKELSTQIEFQRAVLAKSQAQYVEAGGNFRKIKADATTAASSITAAGTQISASAGNISDATSAARVEADAYARASANVAAMMSKRQQAELAAAASGKALSSVQAPNIQDLIRQNTDATAAMRVQLDLLRATVGSTSPAVAELEKKMNGLAAEGYALRQMSASDAIKDLRLPIPSTIAEMRRLGAEMDRIKASDMNGKQKAAAIVGIRNEMERLRQVTAKGGEAMTKNARAFEGWNKTGELVGGRVGNLLTRLSKVGEVAQEGRLATIALAAGFAVLAAAAAAAAVGVAVLGVSLAAQAKDARLAFDAALKLDELKKGAKGADDSGETIANAKSLAQTYGLTLGKTKELALELHKTGLRGNALTDALEGAAIAQQAAGDAGARQFASQVGPLKNNLAAVQKLTSEYRDRLGPIAEAKALTIGASMARLREGVARVFSGLKIEGLERVFARAADLFDEASASSAAMSRLFEVLFQPMVDGAESGINSVISAFKSALIWGLKVRIGYLEVRNSILDAIDMLVKSAEGFSWSGLGRMIVEGILIGIKEGGAALIDGVVSLAEDVYKGFKTTLGIHSPSTLFDVGGGQQIVAGAELGVEKKKPQLRAAVAQAVLPPKPQEIRQEQARKGYDVGAGVGASLGLDGFKPQVGAFARPSIPRPSPPRFRDEAPKTKPFSFTADLGLDGLKTETERPQVNAPAVRDTADKPKPIDFSLGIPAKTPPPSTFPKIPAALPSIDVKAPQQSTTVPGSSSPVTWSGDFVYNAAPGTTPGSPAEAEDMRDQFIDFLESIGVKIGAM